MVRLITALILLITAYSGTSQVLDTTFNGYLSPLVITDGSAPTWTFNSRFINANKTFTGAEVGTDCKVIVYSGGQCYRLTLNSVAYSGGNISGSITDPSGSLTTLPSIGAIVRPTNNRGLLSYVSGVPPNIQSCIEVYNNSILDTIVTSPISNVDSSIFATVWSLGDSLSNIRTEITAGTSSIIDTTITTSSYTIDLSSAKESRVVTNVTTNNINVILPSVAKALLGKTITVNQINSTDYRTIITVSGGGAALLAPGAIVPTDTIVIPAGSQLVYNFTLGYNSTTASYLWIGQQIGSVYKKGENSVYTIENLEERRVATEEKNLVLTSDTTITNFPYLENRLNISYVAPILDRVGAGGGHAFSLRSLFTGDTEPLLTIENEAGDTLEVYALDGVLDTNAVNAFAGTDSIFVRQWWNKVKEDHVRQETRQYQPILALNGSILRDSEGNPRIWFTSDRQLVNLNATTFGNALTYSLIYSRDNDNFGTPFSTKSYSTPNNSSYGVVFNGTSRVILSSVSGLSYANDGPYVAISFDSVNYSNTSHLFSVLSTDTAYTVHNMVYVVSDTSRVTNKSSFSDGLIIGHRLPSSVAPVTGAYSFDGYISELIIFTNDETSSERAIVNDVDGFYNVNTDSLPDNITVVGGYTINLPSAESLSDGQFIKITHNNSGGGTTKLISSSGFQVNDTLVYTLEIEGGLNSTVELKRTQVSGQYVYEIVGTTDINYISGIDTLGTIFLQDVSLVSNLSLPVGKTIQSAAGAVYTVKNSRNINFSAPFSYRTKNNNFAVYDPVLGMAEINKIPFPDSLGGIAKINLLADYLYETREDGVIYFEGDYIVSDTGSIRLPETVSLKGNFNGWQDNNNPNGSWLIAQKTDSVDLIVLEHREAPGQYKTGNTISNLHIVNQGAPLRSLVNMSESLYFILRDCDLLADSCWTGVYDNIDGPAPATISSSIRDVQINNALFSGVWWLGSTATFDRVHIKRSPVGFFLAGGSIVALVNDCEVEDTDSVAVISRVSNLLMDNFYTENVCISCSKNDTTFGSVLIRKADNLRISNSRFNNGDVSSAFYLDSVAVANIYNNYVSGPSRTIIKTDNAGVLNFYGNSAINSSRYIEFFQKNNLDLEKDNFVWGNADNSVSDIEGQLFPDLRSNRGIFLNGHNYDSEYDGDQNILADTIDLIGRHNLFTDSEALDSWSIPSLEVVVTANDTIGPDGITTNAEKIIYSTGGGRIRQQSFTSLPPEERYVLSFWARGAGVESDQYLVLDLSDVLSCLNSDTIFLTSEWTRYAYECKTRPDVADGTGVIGFIISQNDTVHITNVSLRKGSDLTESYITASSTPITSTKVVARGNLELTGELTGVTVDKVYRNIAAAVNFTAYFFDGTTQVPVDTLLGFLATTPDMVGTLDTLRISLVQQPSAPVSFKLVAFDKNATYRDITGISTLIAGQTQITITSFSDDTITDDEILFLICTANGDTNANGVQVQLKLE